MASVRYFQLIRYFYKLFFLFLDNSTSWWINVEKDELTKFIKTYTLPNRDIQIAKFLNEVPFGKFIHVCQYWTEHDDISLLDCVVGIPDGTLSGKNIYDFKGNGYRGEILNILS